MGRHVSHQDTSDLPFSYLIEDQSTSYIVPGANLKSVGTIRDAQKWPRRDARKDPDRLDCINYNLLSPYTIQKMVKGSMILKELQRISGISSEIYTFQSGKIRNSSLRNGLKLYGMAIDKFLGNSLITRIMNSEFSSLQELRERLLPQSKYGDGDWVDISGMIVPKKAVTDIMDDVENDRITDLKSFDERFRILHAEYYEYEWRWAYDMIREHYGISLADAELDDLRNLVMRWKESVVALDNMLYEDARKEFSLTMMTSFGADGDDRQRKQDFVQVRGAKFDNDPFVLSVKEHIRVKSELHDKALARLDVQ